MSSVALAIVLAPVVITAYAYAVYPVLLWVIGRVRRREDAPATSAAWPFVTITVPVFNAGASVAATLERILAVDYPRDRLQILVISDASTDGTDDLVRAMAHRGVELLRMPKRIGKTAAENAALTAARGDIIVNVDATILIPPGSLKPLVRAFEDPTIGVASGRDVSIGEHNQAGTKGESSYTGYEMWVRDLETRVGSIVGASGCFYGIRRSVHGKHLPIHLSWDFASPLVARQLGYRSVSVRDATCIVPRTTAIRTEIRRKVRTMARGLGTLFYLRSLMNPLRYRGFALMLVSHKLLRWLPYLLAPLSVVALGILAVGNTLALVTFAGVITFGVVGVLGIRTKNPHPPLPLAVAGFALAVLCAGFLAWCETFRRTEMATWDPTPRPVAQS